MKQLIDLTKLDADQLRNLETAVAIEIKKRATKEQAEARKKILELANVHGIDLANLQRKKPVTYVNPNNSLETWNGTGRKPAWLKNLLAAGHDLNDFQVPDKPYPHD